MCRVCTWLRVQASIACRWKPSGWSSLPIGRLDLGRGSAPTTVQKVSETFLLARTRTRRRSAIDRVEREAMVAGKARVRIEGRRHWRWCGRGR